MGDSHGGRRSSSELENHGTLKRSVVFCLVSGQCRVLPSAQLGSTRSVCVLSVWGEDAVRGEHATLLRRPLSEREVELCEALSRPHAEGHRCSLRPHRLRTTRRALGVLRRLRNGVAGWRVFYDGPVYQHRTIPKVHHRFCSLRCTSTCSC